MNALGLKIETEVLRNPGESTPNSFQVIVTDWAGRDVGYISTLHPENGWVPIWNTEISKTYQGVGLYPAMLRQLRDLVQRYGFKGIVSRGAKRVGVLSTASWEKFARREPRISQRVAPGGKVDYYLSGLGNSADYEFDYEARYADDGILHVVRIFDSAGNEVGEASALEMYGKKKLAPQEVHVDPAHQRKGLATEAFRVLEQQTGRALGRPSLLSPDGKAFWASRRRK